MPCLVHGFRAQISAIPVTEYFGSERQQKSSRGQVALDIRYPENLLMDLIMPRELARKKSNIDDHRLGA